MEFIRNQYAKAFLTLKTRLLRPFIGCAVAFVLLSAVTGLLFDPLADLLAPVIESFMEAVQDSGIVDQTGNISAFGLFINNVQASGIAALAGFVPFIFLPVLSLALNALVVGAMLGMNAALGNSVIVMLVLGILPHGIFELPAVLLGMAMGVSLCRAMNALVRRKKGALPLEQVLADLARVFVCFIVPLLAVAAVIEANITPLLIGLAG